MTKAGSENLTSITDHDVRAPPTEGLHFPAVNDSSEGRSMCDTLLEEVVMLKWRVLLLIMVTSVGNYFSYNLPGAIGVGTSYSIAARFSVEGKAPFTESRNQVCYSVYSYPSVALSLFGGLLIDKYIGLRKSAVLFTALCFVGSVLFYVGVLITNYPLLVVGRAVSGLGGESVIVAQSAFAARWFKGQRGIAIAFGSVAGFPLVGSGMSFVLSPIVAKRYNTAWACLLAVFISVFSLLACIALAIVDAYAVRHGLMPDETQTRADVVEQTEQHDEHEERHHHHHHHHHRRRNNVVSCLCHFWGHIRELTAPIWILSLIAFLIFAAIFPFIAIAVNLFRVKFSVSEGKASAYVAIYQFVSAGGSPILGALVEHTGRYTLWLIVSCAGFVVVYILLIASPCPAYIISMVMGILYSFFVSCVYPMFPLSVPEHVLGFSYGVLLAAENLGLAIFPLINGPILDAYTPGENSNSTTATSSKSTISISSPPTEADDSQRHDRLPTIKGYDIVESIFIAIAALATMISVLLLVLDRCRGGTLTAAAGTDGDKSDERDPGQDADVEEKGESARHVPDEVTCSHRNPPFGKHTEHDMTFEKTLQGLGAANAPVQDDDESNSSMSGSDTDAEQGEEASRNDWTNTGDRERPLVWHQL